MCEKCHLVGRHSQSPTFVRASTCPCQGGTGKSHKRRGLRPPTYQSPPSRRSVLAESDICPNKHMTMSGRYGQITQTSGSSTTDLPITVISQVGTRRARHVPEQAHDHVRAVQANHTNVGVFDHRPTNHRHLAGRYSQSPTFARTSTCPCQGGTGKSHKRRGLRPPTYPSPSSRRSVLAESDVCPNKHMPMSGRYGQITQTSGPSTADLRA